MMLQDIPAGWYLAGIAFALLVFIVTIYYKYAQATKLANHHIMAKLKLNKMKPDSPTRKRLELAKQFFDEGWKIVKGKEPIKCLESFAKAVELDELACGWKQQFEEKLETIGDLFTVEMDSNVDKYHSMLAEAYMVVLLYTVVSLYGKQQGDLEEDFEVVKTRLDYCVKAQPKNPAIYKLRAEFLQRFGALATKEELIKDFQQSITLAEQDEEGKNLNTYGVDPAQHRRFLLASCHYHLGGLLHRSKDFKGALEHYEKAVEFADENFMHLPDAHFSLTILTLLTARGVEDKTSVMYNAAMHYKRGVEAERRIKRWLPIISVDVSRKLAKELLKKYAQTNPTKQHAD